MKASEIRSTVIGSAGKFGKFRLHPSPAEIPAKRSQQEDFDHEIGISPAN